MFGTNALGTFSETNAPHLRVREFGLKIEKIKKA